MGAASRGTCGRGELLAEEFAVTNDTEPIESPYASVRVAVAVACLLGAQFLHWSVIDQHAKEWAASGEFFFVLALLEGALTMLVIAHLRPWVAAATIAMSAIPAVIWTWDRTVGLPFGPTAGVRGTIGRADVMSVVFEVLTIIALWPFLRSGYGERRPGRVDLTGRLVIGITCAYVLAFSVWAMIGDQAVVHHVGTTTVSGVNATSVHPANNAPLNTSMP